MSELFIKRVKKQVPYFRRVLIETTGLADPAPIIHMMMTAPVISNRYALDGIITTVDAVNADGQLNRHPESVKQAAVADRIVITKSDLAEPAALDALSERLDALNPGAPKVFAVMGEIGPDQLFDTGLYDPKSKTVDVQRWLRDEAYVKDDHGHDYGTPDHDHDHDHDHGHDVNRHDESISAFCVTRDEPIDWEAFVAFVRILIGQHGEKLLRIKGILNIAGATGRLPFMACSTCFMTRRNSPSGRMTTGARGSFSSPTISTAASSKKSSTASPNRPPRSTAEPTRTSRTLGPH